nr:hypothetical protein CFP56_48729 [Quercus suber]
MKLYGSWLRHGLLCLGDLLTLSDTCFSTSQGSVSHRRKYVRTMSQFLGHLDPELLSVSLIGQTPAFRHRRDLCLKGGNTFGQNYGFWDKSCCQAGQTECSNRTMMDIELWDLLILLRRQTQTRGTAVSAFRGSETLASSNRRFQMVYIEISLVRQSLSLSCNEVLVKSEEHTNGGRRRTPRVESVHFYGMATLRCNASSYHEHRASSKHVYRRTGDIACGRPSLDLSPSLSLRRVLSVDMSFYLNPIGRTQSGGQ